MFCLTHKWVCKLTILKRHYWCLSLYRSFYWHARWYLYLLSVQPNQANKRVNFQLAISSYLPISGHQGRIGAHDLQQCCFFTSPFLMAGRSAWMRVIRSEWSKNDIKYNCTSIFNINWTLCLHHGWSEVERVDANFGQHTRALERACRKQIEKLRDRTDRSDQLSKPVRPVP